MRNLGVRFQIDIHAVEHDPFAVGRRHRRTDTLKFHHVLEREGMFGVLREGQCGKRENECEENSHQTQSFRPKLLIGKRCVCGAQAAGL